VAVDQRQTGKSSADARQVKRMGVAREMFKRVPRDDSLHGRG